MKIREVRLRTAGIVLICFCVATLLWEVQGISRRGSIDAPASDRQEDACFKGYGDGAGLYWDGKPVEPGLVRIFLTLNLFPRGFYGGTILANQAVGNDTASVGTDFHFQRRGDLLIVNGANVPPGKSYTRRKIHWAFRLWALPYTLTEISNRGVFHCFRTQQGDHPMNALYARGRLKEGWAPSPAGPIFLVVGIGLLIKGRSETSLSGKRGGRAGTPVGDPNPCSRH